MSKVIYCGMESQGKSLLLGSKALKILKRNRKYFQKGKTKERRKVWSNLIFSKEIENNFINYIRYWNDMSEIIGVTGCDIIWDEISTDLSALKKEPLPQEVNRWLRQGAKQGVEIYATAQEFHDVHLDFRRRVKEAYIVKKICGSNRGGENLPKVRFIWGLCLYRELIINPYNELMPEYKSIIPRGFIIDRERCELFDTHQVILSSDEIPLQHIARKCLTCGYKKVIHK